MIINDIFSFYLNDHNPKKTQWYMYLNKDNICSVL